MFERETRKEKTLEQLKKMAEKKVAPREKPEVKNAEEKKANLLKQVENNFYEMIGEDPDYEEQDQSLEQYGHTPPKRQKEDDQS